MPVFHVMKKQPAQLVFTRSKLVTRGDRFIVYDRNGRMVLPVTMYLIHLLTYGRSVKTVHQYGRQIVAVLRALEVSSIDLFDVHDGTLLLLRDHALLIQKMKVKTWKSLLSQFLKMLVFAQKQKFCANVIGVNSGEEIKYQISLLPGENVRHELMNQRGEGYEVIDLPHDDDFELVETELTSARAWALRKQRQAMVNLLRGGPLRRSELVSFKKEDLPTHGEFVRLLEKMRKKQLPPVVKITFWRAKKQNDRRRSASMTVELVRELIYFRDKVRPLLLKNKIDPPQLFVSVKSGKGYEAQSVTNLVKISANRAASKYGEHLKAIRPHFYRHRAATTTLRHHLAAGIEPVQAFLLVMGDMDVTFETMCIYLHNAQLELQVGSPEYHKASTALNDLALLRSRFYEALDADWRRRGKRRYG